MLYDSGFVEIRSYGGWNIHLNPQGGGGVVINPGKLYLADTSGGFIEVSQSAADLTLTPGAGGGRIVNNCQYIEFGDAHVACLRLLGGSSGSGSLYFYEGATLNALLRHTPSSNYAEFMNYNLLQCL